MSLLSRVSLLPTLTIAATRLLDASARGIHTRFSGQSGGGFASDVGHEDIGEVMRPIADQPDPYVLPRLTPLLP